MPENINKKLLEKAFGAATKEEALAILRQGGLELTEDDLRNIAGGEEDEGICWTHETPCSWLCPHHGEKCISHCWDHCNSFQCPDYGCRPDY